MMKCDICKVSYPEELLTSLIIGKEIIESVCGICALETTNKIHGINRKEFLGDGAEYLRQKAIEWRRKGKGK